MSGSEVACVGTNTVCGLTSADLRLCDHSCLGRFISIKTVIKLSFLVTSSLPTHTALPLSTGSYAGFLPQATRLSSPVCAVDYLKLRAELYIIWLEFQAVQMILKLTLASTISAFLPDVTSLTSHP